MKVVRLPALRTGRLYSPENIPGPHFCYKLSQNQSRSAAGSIDTIGNLTRDLTVCSAVPLPPAPLRARPKLVLADNNASQVKTNELLCTSHRPAPVTMDNVQCIIDKDW
jgi:hypothetical protein